MCVQQEDCSVCACSRKTVVCVQQEDFSAGQPGQCSAATTGECCLLRSSWVGAVPCY